MNKMTGSMPEVNPLLCSEQLKGKTEQNKAHKQTKTTQEKQQHTTRNLICCPVDLYIKISA